MIATLRILARLLGLLVALASLSSAAPVANPDSYELAEDSVLTIDASLGVLDNDGSDPDSALSAVLQSAPSNGRLQFESDGSFTYAPDPNFNGPDSFTYLAEQVPEVLTFTVDQSRSSVSFGATITNSGITASDSDTSSLAGTLQLFLAPASPPFNRVQIRDATLVLADGVNLDFDFKVFFVTVASVDVDAEPGALSLQMATPGDETTVDAGGGFTQPGNSMRVGGEASVTATIDLGLPPNPQNLDTVIDNVELGGTLVESGGIITLTAPVVFSGDFDLGGNPISISIDGTVVATAPSPAATQSAAQTAFIEVDPVNDAPSLKADSYDANDGTTGPVPILSGVLANDLDIDGDSMQASLVSGPENGSVSLDPAGSFEYTGDGGFVGTDSFIYSVGNGGGTGSAVIVPAGSVWRYLDDGSDQGTAWRATGFADGAWAEGAAELGYGEGDEASVVSFGPDAGAKHITTYFRRAFYIGDPGPITSLLIRLLRDDAAAIYLNGTEVYRDPSLPQEPNAVLFNSTASGAVDETLPWLNISVPASALVEGTNVLAVEVHQSAPDSSDLSFDLSLEGQVPAWSALVRFDDVWRFLDNGSDQGSAWRALGFEDAAWSSGAAPLGYGETAVVTPVSFGPSGSAKFTTTYFRHTFELIDADRAIAGQLRLRRDDGVAVYLNGVEIARDNLAQGAAAGTFAGGAIGGEDEGEVLTFSIDPALFQEGENVLAAEVHQSSLSSSDLFFEAELGVSLALLKQRTVIEVLTPNPADPDSDNDGMLDSWELANGLIVGIDDSGLDGDGDGSTNISEFIADTDPQDPASKLQILSVEEVAGGDYKIIVATIPGISYRLQTAADAMNWLDVGGSDWTADSAAQEITVSPGAGPQLWRAIVVVP